MIMDQYVGQRHAQGESNKTLSELDETPFHSLDLTFDARECARIWFEPVELEVLVKKNGTVLSHFIPFSAPDDLMGGIIS